MILRVFPFTRQPGENQEKKTKGRMETTSVIVAETAHAGQRHHKTPMCCILLSASNKRNRNGGVSGLYVMFLIHKRRINIQKK